MESQTPGLQRIWGAVWKKEKEAQKESKSHSQHMAKLAPGPTSPQHARSLALSTDLHWCRKKPKAPFLELENYIRSLVTGWSLMPERSVLCFGVNAVLQLLRRGSPWLFSWVARARVPGLQHMGSTGEGRLLCHVWCHLKAAHIVSIILNRATSFDTQPSLQAP